MMLGSHPMWMARGSGGSAPPLSFTLVGNTGGPNSIIYTMRYVDSTYIGLTYYVNPQKLIGADLNSLSMSSAIYGNSSTVFKGNVYYNTEDSKITRITPSGDVSTVYTGSTIRSVTSDQNYLYGFGAGGAGVRSSDGSTFTSMTTGTTDTLFGFSYVIGSSVFATGVGGRLVYSGDSGSTFTSTSVSPISPSSNGINMGDAVYINQNISTTTTPYMYKTINGTSFSTVYLGITLPAAGTISGFGERAGELYIMTRVQSSGQIRIVKTSNGGTTFTEVTPPFATSSNNSTLTSANGFLVVTNGETGDIYVSN